MILFKDAKHQPIRLRGFKFIGFHEDYPNACYYYKELPRDNFEIMECILEGARKPELGAGTTIKVIDAFMANYLYSINNKVEYKTNFDFIKGVIDTTYNDFEKETKELMATKFNSAIPEEIKATANYKKYVKDGFNVLYCSNDEADDRKMGIVNLVMVKEHHIKSTDPRIPIDRKYSVFKPFKYRTLPSYIQGKSKDKYMEENIAEIVVCHDLLV